MVVLGRVTGIAVLILSLSFTGGLADPAPRGFVTFSALERNHFTALSVWHERATGISHAAALPQGAAPGALESLGPGALPAPPRAITLPLVVRVNVIGEATNPALAEAAEFLRRELNVVLVHDPRGVPLVLTRENLIATSGPASLGATLSSGMAAEVGNPRMAGCVIAHEIGHFLGLPHADESGDLMFPRCAEGKLSHAMVSPQARARVDQLGGIRALTPNGLVTWATR